MHKAAFRDSLGQPLYMNADRVGSFTPQAVSISCCLLTNQLKTQILQQFMQLLIAGRIPQCHVYFVYSWKRLLTSIMYPTMLWCSVLAWTMMHCSTLPESCLFARDLLQRPPRPSSTQVQCPNYRQTASYNPASCGDPDGRLLGTGTEWSYWLNVGQFNSHHWLYKKGQWDNKMHYYLAVYNCPNTGLD